MAQATKRLFSNVRSRILIALLLAVAVGITYVRAADSLVNNNAGSTGTANFTQSETAIVAFGNTVVIGFNDSGSNSGGANHFTGFSRSTDGGATFTDGGNLPASVGGDAGDPVLARNETTGRIYFATLGFNVGTIQVWRSDDNGVTWVAPVNGTPGGASEDKEWLTVDNFAGAGNGNVYLISRNFGSGNGIYLYRSTDHGATFGPNAGTLIASGNQGAFVTVGPNHAVYAFWYAGATIQMRKSTDLGVTFGAPVTVASGLVGGTNGDLGLTGQRNGAATFSGFRSNEFPHAAVNPVTGNIYAVFANDGPAADKADIMVVQSTDGGATWSAPTKVNDDATTTDQWQPTLAVSPDGSKLGIFYYSRQEDPVNNNLFKYYGRIASISGSTLTFLPSFAISNTPSLPEFGRDSVVNSVYMGDYDMAAATPGAFHVVWSDSRDDLAGGAPRKDPNVRYAKISLGLSVVTTVPAVGSVIGTQPTTFQVNFTDPVQPGSLNASDFLVDGSAANGVSYTPGTTLATFTFASTPVVAQGVHTMTMAAGAVLRASDGNALAAFSGDFRYDALALQVTTTVPAVSGTFTLPGPFTYDVNFNEPVDPMSVDTSDLALSGIGGATVSGVTVLAGNTTARFTISGVSTEGTLTASLAAGTITDVFGNPNDAFSGNYAVDIGTAQYPVPLAAKAPGGSLVYDPGVGGTISAPGDLDNLTIDVDAGQTISLIVTPSAGLRPRVELFDTSNSSMGFAQAVAAGSVTGIETASVVSAGTYRIAVNSADGTTGTYTLQVILNAAFELEGLIPSPNSSIATAQDINASFVTLQTSQNSAQRGAVLGTSDGSNYQASPVAFATENIESTGTIIPGLTNQDDAAVNIPIGFTFPFYSTNQTSLFVSSNGLLTFGTANTAFTNTDLTTAPPQAAIAPLWDDLYTAGGVVGSGVYFQNFDSGGPDERLVIQWNKIRFFSGGVAGNTITFQAVLYKDGRIRFNYPDLFSTGALDASNGASATVGIKGAGVQGDSRLLLAFNNGPNAYVGNGQSTLINPSVAAPDYYSFTAAAGDVITLAVKSLPAGPLSLQLRDAADVILATGAGGNSNLDSRVANFAVGSAGTYYARVATSATGPGVAYNLIVTRNAAFDAEPNDSAGSAQSIGGNRGALGRVETGVGLFSAQVIPFAFENISATGTEIVGLTGGDDTSVSIPVGFNFPFYGANQANVNVSSNGLLTFGGADTSFTNTDLSASPALASIAAFWDDQIVSNPGRVLYQVLGAGSDQHLTIQWNQVSFFSGGTAGDTITYQAQLYIDGRIQLNYLDLTSGSAGGNNGASATVGVKNLGPQGSNRLLLAFNNGPNAFVGTGKSTLFSPTPSDDWYSITSNGVDPIVLETSTPGDGPFEPVNTFNPHIELYNSAGNSLLASGNVLGDGRNEAITIAQSAGNYKVRVAAEGGTVGEYFLSTGVSNEWQAGGITLTQESCVLPNAQADPGERVTASFRIINGTTSGTSNLVATLLTGGGVIAPTGAQTYGAIPAGGQASKAFAFTVDGAVAPNGTVTATLQLQDGTTNLGTLPFVFAAGPNPCGIPRMVTTTSLQRIDPNTVRATIKIQNTGAVEAQNVTLTTAKLGTTSGTVLPQVLGNVAPGAAVTATVDFANATPGAASSLSTAGTFTGGAFNAAARVVIP